MRPKCTTCGSQDLWYESECRFNGVRHGGMIGVPEYVWAATPDEDKRRTLVDRLTSALTKLLLESCVLTKHGLRIKTGA